MKNLIIVDGYNVLIGYYKENIPFKNKRGKFLTDVSSCKYYSNYEIIVVFDSKEQSFDYSEKYRQIEVIYSGYQKSADIIIGNLINSKKGYDKIIVVSSDRLVQNTIFGSKNTVRKSSREFNEEIKKL